MTMRKISKWVASSIVLLSIVTGLSIYFFIDHELGLMYGEFTDRAEIDLENTTSNAYALTNVNVLNKTADQFIKSQTVVVRNGIIESISKNSLPISDIKIIDGKGLFLVPGYTESHAHLWESENDLLLFLANGVTQIREMNGLKKHLRWKKEINAGRPGPDMFVVAPQLATFGFFEGLFVGWTQNKKIVRSSRDIDRAVASLKSMGYDAIKASSFLDSSGYDAVSAATSKYKIPLIGHIPNSVGLAELWQSNQEEIAHIEELVKSIDTDFGGFTPDTAGEFLEYVRDVSNGVAARLHKKGIAVTTTLTLIDSFWKQKKDLPKALSNVQLAYVNPGLTEGTKMTSRGLGWLSDVNLYRWPEDISEERKEQSLIYWQTYSKAQYIILDALINNDVKLMAGTDTNVPIMVPGFSLHNELMTLQQAGMSPAAALASTTIIPGEWMNINTGQITPGFKANLVLLRENPLENIDATDSIEMVFSNRYILSRKNLDSILLAVKFANDNSRRQPL